MSDPNAAPVPETPRAEEARALCQGCFHERHWHESACGWPEYHNEKCRCVAFVPAPSPAPREAALAQQINEQNARVQEGFRHIAAAREAAGVAPGEPLLGLALPESREARAAVAEDAASLRWAAIRAVRSVVMPGKVLTGDWTTDQIADAVLAVAADALAAAQTREAALRAENERLQGEVSRVHNLWRAATETDVVKALQGCVDGAYEYGTQDGEFVAAYVTPTGPIHRAIPVLQALGIVARPRAQEVMPPALVERVQGEAGATIAALRTDLAQMTFFRDETERQFQRAVEQINSEYSRAETAEADLEAARDRLDGDAWDRITAERDALRQQVQQIRALCADDGPGSHQHVAGRPEVKVSAILAILDSAATPEDRT